MRGGSLMSIQLPCLLSYLFGKHLFGKHSHALKFSASDFAPKFDTICAKNVGLNCT